MKKFARGFALTVVALIGLVPIQATSAMAAPETLDVEPEVVLRVTGSIQRYTATLSAPAAANRTLMYDTDGTVGGDQAACSIAMGDSSCSFIVTETAPTEYEALRVYVNDPTSPPTTVPCGTPILGNDCDATEAQDEAATPGAQAEPDDTDVVTLEFADGTLDLSPEDVPAAAAAPVNITASIMSTEMTPRGLIGNVDAEIISGPETDVAGEADFECTTVQAGNCTLTFNAANTLVSAVNEVQGWIDLNDDAGCGSCTPAQPETGDETGAAPAFEGDATERQNEGSASEKGAVDEPDITDVVKVNITVGTPSLSLAPKTQTKTINTAASFTASVNLGTTPQQNVKIAGSTITGSGNLNKTATCTTGANGTCVLTYTGTAAGTDKFRATIDTDSNGLPNEADSTEDIGVAGGTPEPDSTDVAQVTYQNPTPPPGNGGGGDDDSACNAAKAKLKKAKAKLKKAKKSGDEQKIAKAKKRVKKAKKRKIAACAG